MKPKRQGPPQVDWLEPRPGYLRAMRIVMGVGLGVMMLSQLSFFLFPLTGDRLWLYDVILAMLPLTIGVTAICIVAIYLGWRLAFRSFPALRVGISEKGFHARGFPAGAPLLDPKEVGPLPWNRVFTDGGRILADRVVVPVRMGQLPYAIFDAYLLERRILGAIPANNHVTRLQFFWMSWKSMSFLRKVTVPLIIVGAIAVTFINRGWHP